MAYNTTWIGSPNYTPGRTQPIQKIIIHWMAGLLVGTDAQFQTLEPPEKRTSAHYGVENSVRHQYVKLSDTAWHAMDANPFSIGIEHSAGPGRKPTNATYANSIDLCAKLCKEYGLDPYTDIEPHSKYVITQCPGNIDLNRIRRGVKQKLEQERKEMLTNENHLAVLYQVFLDRPPKASEVKRYLGKVTYKDMVHKLDNSSERAKAEKTMSVGRKAIMGNWEQQIDTMKGTGVKPVRLKPGVYEFK